MYKLQYFSQISHEIVFTHVHMMHISKRRIQNSESKSITIIGPEDPWNLTRNKEIHSWSKIV